MSGLVVAIMGAILLFWIIPSQTEIVMDSGWLSPSTLPRITAAILIITGLIHFIFPKGKTEFDVTFSMRMALFFALTSVGIYLMHLIGFVFVAPILILVIMIMIGERRPIWLISGIILLPASIWFCVAFLLNKSLP